MRDFSQFILQINFVCNSRTTLFGCVRYVKNPVTMFFLHSDHCFAIFIQCWFFMKLSLFVPVFCVHCFAGTITFASYSCLCFFWWRHNICYVFCTQWTSVLLFSFSIVVMFVRVCQARLSIHFSFFPITSQKLLSICMNVCMCLPRS